MLLSPSSSTPPAFEQERLRRACPLRNKQHEQRVISGRALINHFRSFCFSPARGGPGGEFERLKFDYAVTLTVRVHCIKAAKHSTDIKQYTAANAALYAPKRATQRYSVDRASQDAGPRMKRLHPATQCSSMQSNDAASGRWPGCNLTVDPVDPKMGK